MNILIKRNKNTKLNAGLYFAFSIIQSFVIMLIGFIWLKCTITYFGESTNGMSRFVNQIFSYFAIIEAGIMLSINVRIISYYKDNKNEHIFVLLKIAKKICLCIGLFYFVSLFSFGVWVAKILETNTLNFNFSYLFFLSFAVRPIFNILFFQVPSILLTSTNNGYLVFATDVLVRISIFLFALFIIFVSPPKLTITYQQGVYITIIDIKNSSTFSIYSIIIANLCFSFVPIFGFILYKLFIKLDPPNYLKIERAKNEIKKEKSNLKNQIIANIITSVSLLVLTNTDEFVFLMLRNGNNEEYIFKLINIYGIYVSILYGAKLLFDNYIYSKRVNIGLYNPGSKERTEYVKMIKRNIVCLSTFYLAFFFIFSIIVSRYIFAPDKNDSLYSNPNIPLALVLVYFTLIINLTSQVELQVDKRVRVVMWIGLIESSVNIILSISLVKILGFYWVIWATVIAEAIKLIIYELTLRKLKYSSQFAFYSLKSKWNIITLILFLVFGFEIILFFATYGNINTDFIQNWWYVMFLIFIIIVFLGIVFLSKKMVAERTGQEKQ